MFKEYRIIGSFKDSVIEIESGYIDKEEALSNLTHFQAEYPNYSLSVEEY